MDVTARVKDLIRGVVESEGFELVNVEFERRGASSILRVYIDHSGGVTVSDCALISRRTEVLLDVEDVILSKYVLEVSSPGIERPLFAPEDYLRFMGKEIRLTTIDKIENRRKFKGVIENYRTDILSLDCEGEMVTIPFSNIRKAYLVYKFG